jgi:hypothetical protein
LVCKLEGAFTATLWAVHLQGSGRDIGDLATALSAFDLNDVIVCGDFNFDLRDGADELKESPDKLGVQGKHYKNLVGEYPKIKEFVERNSRIFPEHLNGPEQKRMGSCNKMRTPFQAQVTKILLPDFMLKDYVLVGKDLQVGQTMAGLIDTEIMLPNERYPSDHTLVASEVWTQRNAVPKFRLLHDRQRAHGSLHRQPSKEGGHNLHHKSTKIL